MKARSPQKVLAKKQNGPPEMPVPELPTVSEVTANVRSSAGESVLSLDSGFRVADFHPEYEYFDDQLISQPPLMSSQHSSTANTQPARQFMLLPAGQLAIQPVSQQRFQPDRHDQLTSTQNNPPARQQLTNTQYYPPARQQQTSTQNYPLHVSSLLLLKIIYLHVSSLLLLSGAGFN